jgi:hypothetical protein
LGSLIGGGFVRTVQLIFPRLKVEGDPGYSLSNTGENEHTVTFRALIASANPSGMIDRAPYARVINTRSTRYLK